MDEIVDHSAPGQNEALIVRDDGSDLDNPTTTRADFDRTTDRVSIAAIKRGESSHRQSVRRAKNPMVSFRHVAT